MGFGKKGVNWACFNWNSTVKHWFP